MTGSAAAIALRPGACDEVGALFDDLRRFIDRRFSELSVEVHGAVQLLDFSETNLSGQLAAIHAQIAGLVAAPALATRNSGLELEAVVQATEAAADRILEAAEAIGQWVADGRRDPAGYELLTAKVNAIFEACSFQDLTGQRIRRAIDQLQRIEVLLGNMMTAAPGPAPQTPQLPAPSHGHDLGQQDVDALLA